MIDLALDIVIVAGGVVVGLVGVVLLGWTIESTDVALTKWWKRRRAAASLKRRSSRG